MTNPDGSWIDLRSTMTCKQIHDEASDYALRQMEFSTWSGQASGTYAGRFEYIMTALQVLYAKRVFPRVALDQKTCEEMSKALPRFAPCLEAVKADSHVGPGGYPESCREIPSVFRKLVRSCVQKSSSDGRHRNKPSKSTTTSPATLYTDVQLATLDPAPWSIPSLRDLERMESSIRSARARFLQGLDIWQWFKHRYSAAALAVRFLKSLPYRTRMRITYIVLDKDRPAVGFAECHGLGLIPYCQENKRLLVERKVDLWRNAFHTTTAHGGIYELRRRYYNSQWGITTPTVLATKYISHTVPVWIMEASELRAAGMPSGSFTLTFKGDPVCSDIFQTVVIRDAAWQLAMEKCFERGTLPKAMHPKSPYFWTSNNSWYIFDGFPRAIQDMLDKTSVVKCDFDLGVGIDVEDLIEGKLAACADLKVWEEGWSIRERNYLEPHRPLPSWDSLLWENCTQ